MSEGYPSNEVRTFFTTASPHGLELSVDWAACAVVLLSGGEDGDDGSPALLDPMLALDVAASSASAASASDDDDAVAVGAEIVGGGGDAAITTTFRLVFQGMGCLSRCPERRFAFVNTPENWAFTPFRSSELSTDYEGGGFQRQQEQFETSCEVTCASTGAECMAIYIGHAIAANTWVCHGLQTIGPQLYAAVDSGTAVGNSYVKQINGVDVVPGDATLFQNLQVEALLAERSGETTTAAAAVLADAEAAAAARDAGTVSGSFEDTAEFSTTALVSDDSSAHFMTTVVPVIAVMGALLLFGFCCWCNPRCCCGRARTAYGCPTSCWSCCCRAVVVHRAKTVKVSEDRLFVDAQLRRYARAEVQLTADAVTATGQWPVAGGIGNAYDIGSITSSVLEETESADVSIISQAPHLREMLESASRRTSGDGQGTPQLSPGASSAPGLATVAEGTHDRGNTQARPYDGEDGGGGVSAGKTEQLQRMAHSTFQTSRKVPTPPPLGVTSSAQDFTAMMQTGDGAADSAHDAHRLQQRGDSSSSFKGASPAVQAARRMHDRGLGVPSNFGNNNNDNDDNDDLIDRNEPVANAAAAAFMYEADASMLRNLSGGSDAGSWSINTYGEPLPSTPTATDGAAGRFPTLTIASTDF